MKQNNKCSSVTALITAVLAFLVLASFAKSVKADEIGENIIHSNTTEHGGVFFCLQNNNNKQYLSYK